MKEPGLSTPKELILVLGGARAGKSTLAQRLAAARRGRGAVLFVATAEAGDAEMRRRIQRHQRARPGSWQTLEEPRAVVDRLAEASPAPAVLLLDCLTLWVLNLLLASLPSGRKPTAAALERAQRQVIREVKRLLRLYQRGTASLIVVSNEVGLGIVPADPVSRAYRDALGQANQQVAAQADRVYLMVAGIPVEIKSGPTAM